jgi:hypothetical protein
MRRRILIGPAAIAILGGWLAACSKPASERGQAARDIGLPAAPVSEAPIVSTLEAGTAATSVPVLQPAHRAPALVKAVTHQMAEVPARIDQPELAVPRVLTAQSSAGMSLTAAPEHVPMEIEAEWERNSKGDEGAYPLPTPGPSHGNPTIIIRGGPGGIEDKCDLRPRGGRGGIAINRNAPSFGRDGIR